MRLFDVFSGSLGLLEARNKRYMKWSSKANSNNWTSNWVQNLFEKYNIISKFGPSTDASGKMIHPRKSKSVITIPEAPIDETATVPEKAIAIFYADRPVQPEQLTDEELELGIKEYSLSLQLLQQEKAKRDAIKAKKADLLKVFSDMAKDEGFSLEDIMELVWVNRFKNVVLEHLLEKK